MSRRVPGATLGVAALLLVGCGDDWAPTGVGAASVLAEGAAGATAFDELIDLSQDIIVGAPTAPAPATADAQNPELLSEPRAFFLFYADGGPAPSSTSCGAGVPAKYTCTFGSSTEDCRAKVQPFLDKFYADFNIVFTYTKPTSGIYYTEVITSSSSWCPGAPAGIAGVGPLASDCSDYKGETCYAFMCGVSARTCAVIIAQEHGHLVGLEHTNSNNDLMYPQVCPSCTSFENKDNPTSIPRCRNTQNSYQLMKERLGAWPGGTKPSPGGGAGGSGGSGGAGGGGGGSGGSGGGSGGSGGGSSGGSGGSGGNGGSGGSGSGGSGGSGAGGNSVSGGGCAFAATPATALPSWGLGCIALLGARSRRARRL